MSDTIQLDTVDEVAERTPGDFQRTKKGAPQVLSLTETRQRVGLKAELIEQCHAAGIDPSGLTVPKLKEALGPEPRRVTYGRPSGYGDLIQDMWNLMKWKERQVALGVAIDPSLLHELDGVPDDDAKAERAALDRICNRAHDVAGSNIARERGTYIHALTEWADEVEL